MKCEEKNKTTCNLDKHIVCHGKNGHLQDRYNKSIAKIGSNHQTQQKIMLTNLK